MLVKLVDDETTAIIPVVRISAVTTGKKNRWKEISESTVASKTRLQVPSYSMMSKLASARVLLQPRLINYLLMSKLLCAPEQDLKKLLTMRKL